MITTNLLKLVDFAFEINSCLIILHHGFHEKNAMAEIWDRIDKLLLDLYNMEYFYKLNYSF